MERQDFLNVAFIGAGAPFAGCASRVSSACEISSCRLDKRSFDESSRQTPGPVILQSFVPVASQSGPAYRITTFNGFRKAGASSVFGTSATNVFWARSARNVTVVCTAEEAVAEAPAEVAAAEDVSFKASRSKEGALALESLSVGQELTGTVCGVQKYGAFVDIGATADGLVHISELATGFVKNVEDVVKVGDQVQVRIKEIDPEKNRVALTMLTEDDVAKRKEQSERKGTGPDGKRRPRRPARKGLDEIEIGQEFTGAVTSIMEFGAFVNIGASTDGLVHISQISNERIESVQDVLQVGQEVKVRVISVDADRDRISLSMRDPAEAGAEGQSSNGTGERRERRPRRESINPTARSGASLEADVNSARQRRVATSGSAPARGERRSRRREEHDPDRIGDVLETLPAGASALEIAFRRAAARSAIKIELPEPTPDPVLNEDVEIVQTVSAEVVPAPVEDEEDEDDIVAAARAAAEAAV